jgi:hypothetical protein
LNTAETFRPLPDAAAGHVCAMTCRTATVGTAAEALGGPAGDVDGAC